MGTLPRAVGIPVLRTFTVYRGGGYRYHVDLIIISSGRFSWVISLNGVPLVLPHQNLVISFYSCSEYFFYICNWTCICFAIAVYLVAGTVPATWQVLNQCSLNEWVNEQMARLSNWRKSQRPVECTAHTQLEINLVGQGEATLLTRTDFKAQVGECPGSSAWRGLLPEDIMETIKESNEDDGIMQSLCIQE